MSLILVDELQTELVQENITSLRNQNVRAIRLNLYKHNNPVGTLQVQVKDSNNNLLGSSEIINIYSIGSDFFHGFITFNNLNVQFKKNTNYKIILTSSGYSFSESSYVGWVKDYTQQSYSYSSTNNSFDSSYSFEIWSI